MPQQSAHPQREELPGRDLTARAEPRVLMLGMGWFPATLGGLNRYYRSLLEELPRASGVVIGPAEDAPDSVSVVADASAALPRRVLGYWRASRRAARATDIIDAHFALYAAAPLLLGGAQRRPVVFHFQGPWADENVAAGDSSRIRHAARARLERAVHARVDAHVVLSSAFRRVLVERYRVRPWEVHVWAPGVALERFTPGARDQARRELGLTEDAFVAVCTRRLVARMGLDVLLDAWGEIASELPRGSLLLLVGDGPLREHLGARRSRHSSRGACASPAGSPTRSWSRPTVPRTSQWCPRWPWRASAWWCSRRPRAGRRASSATWVASRRQRWAWTPR